MMTIIILKLHMNNDPSSGVSLSNPDIKDSRSSMSTLWCLLTILQAPFIKEKKVYDSVRLIFVRRKVFLSVTILNNMFHAFSMLAESSSGSSCLCILIHLLNQKWQTSYAIFEGEKCEFSTCCLMSLKNGHTPLLQHLMFYLLRIIGIYV